MREDRDGLREIERDEKVKKVSLILFRDFIYNLRIISIYYIFSIISLR